MAAHLCWSKREVVVALARAISQSFSRALRTMSGHLTSIEAMREDNYCKIDTRLCMCMNLRAIRSET